MPGTEKFSLEAISCVNGVDQIVNCELLVIQLTVVIKGAIFAIEERFKAFHIIELVIPLNAM